MHVGHFAAKRCEKPRCAKRQRFDSRRSSETWYFASMRIDKEPRTIVREQGATSTVRVRQLTPKKRSAGYKKAPA